MTALDRVRALAVGWARDFDVDDTFRVGDVLDDLQAAIAGPPVDLTGLTWRQRDILTTISASIVTRGYPPTLREIGNAVGMSSVSSVAHQLQILERRGLIQRDPSRSRAITIAEVTGG